MLKYTVRPISDRTQFTGPPPKGDRSPFRSSTWASTQRLLEFELDKIDARNVVLEIDVTEHDLRLDGTLRTSADPAGPGVRLAFESMHGPLIYGTDRYGWTYTPGRYYRDGWQQNARAIALGLEALRKIDRYGITKRGEQYRGWKAIGAGTGVLATSMTTDVAVDIIDREAGWTAGGNVLTQEHLPRAARAAKANAHPDRHNGDRARFDAVDQAVQVLERAGRL